ncbi:MAG TPA: electron transfer flavoprotein subunit beta/FixA family protein [Thermoplasmata archaeon]|nr:electron transfer flavoprotein subunit beta/FixA family protein [Thermoplasmata archaeon]
MPLNLVVCLKQIPNPDLQFSVTPDGRDIRREGLNYKINGSDEYALEEAVRLKEKNGGRVVAVTVGPKRAESILREALAKGADEAVRVAYDDPAAFDVGKVARILAAAVKTLPHDLVLTGVQSDDYSNSATGGLVAGILGLPHVSVVTKVQVQGDGLQAWSELEGGLQRRYSVGLPALLSIQFGANTPRYAPLPAIMKAARVPIKEIAPAALGLASWEAVALPYAFAVRGLAPPAAKGHAEFIPGPVEEQAKKLAQLLREKGFVRR